MPQKPALLNQAHNPNPHMVSAVVFKIAVLRDRNHIEIGRKHGRNMVTNMPGFQGLSYRRWRAGFGGPWRLGPCQSLGRAGRRA